VNLMTPRADATKEAVTQSLWQAVGEAFCHRSYLLLVLGYFTCGFQLAFITVHLPAYLVDRGLSAQVGGWTIACIGLFNIAGSLSRLPRRLARRLGVRPGRLL
jgi:cyanate permease